ncbi:MAG: methyltransferase [Massilia sp.]|jgi:SAM-dependent methyltransferase|nr:methyltransferase [Massilia sp.]MDB5953243.1 methyltransferase [Massilia sp.]
MTAGGTEPWEVARLYEPYVGRWSRLVAHQFVAWLNPSSNLEWFDVGCGTGALTAAVLDKTYPNYVTCVDPSPGFIAHARERIPDPRASFAVGDAMSLPAGARYDAAVAGLVLNFIPDPLAAVRQMARAVRPKGLVAAYVWDYAGKMELMRAFWDAAAGLDPAAADLDEGRRFPLCAPGPLRALFAQAGLADIEVIAIEVPTNFRDFDDYWRPFLGGQGPAPAYAMSLGEAHRSKLRERLRASLPTAANGSIRLTARAWAIRGTRQDTPTAA